MGLFDKLKSFANSITGGGAQVTVQAVEPLMGKPFPVVVRAVVSSVDLKIAGVYVMVESEEEIKIERRRVFSELKSELDEATVKKLESETGHFKMSETTSQTKAVIAGAQELKANQSYEWKGEITLPAGVLPTFIGKNARHVWRVKGGLDAVGNDPDSGWIEIQIKG